MTVIRTDFTMAMRPVTLSVQAEGPTSSPVAKIITTTSTISTATINLTTPTPSVQSDVHTTEVPEDSTEEVLTSKMSACALPPFTLHS